jgi:hypothetical protein
LRDIGSRGERRRLREKDPFAFVGFDLPFVGWVRFPNVDDEELNLIAETAMELDEVPSLGTKRGSGVAAEYQSNRPSSAKGGELHLLGIAEARQLEVGRIRADLRRKSLALRKELHHRGASFWLHRGSELHHPIEVLFGQMFSE